MHQNKATILITSFNEPETIGRAIEHAQKQKTSYDYDILISAPDSETLAIAEGYALLDDRIKLFKDEGKGKSFAINSLLPKITSDILILTDGDVYISDNAVESIMKAFENPEIGCVSGKVVPTNDPTKKMGYFAHTLALGADLERQRRDKKGLFSEVSGYLFGYRSILINSFPQDCAEDAIISMIIDDLDWRIGYVPTAEVYVKYPTNLEDFVKQKVRTAKSHENLTKYFPNANKMKSFSNELIRGLPMVIGKSLREIGWTIQLMFLRLIIWVKARKGNQYKDGWEVISSSK